ncbi:MAG: hypothetical protein EAZ92_09510 [Candidatus Kapaibacterium sp.]|nr:MAG: hypothetical protein EAZ92_09510 [Candidatus Kapabacteria bacterium]
MSNNNKQTEKEQWEDEILSSVQGIQRSETPPFLFTRIQSRIQSRFRGADNRVTAPTLALGVAAFVALCCVNIWVLADSAIANTSNTKAQSLQSTSALETVSFDLY